MEFPDQILELLSGFIGFGDTHVICQQFDRVLIPNKQVLWNGVGGFRELVQKWADRNDLQTLTTVMGPLMWESNPSYGKPGSGKRSNYVKGACVLFAWYISKGDKVTVMTLPPDEKGDRFNPSRYTNYRGIEEPIVKGLLGNKAVGEMLIVHPTLPGAEKYFYPLWPMDGLLAMEAILNTRGRGLWKWRIPNPPEKVKAHLDLCTPKVCSKADESTASAAAIYINGMKAEQSQGSSQLAQSITTKTTNQEPVKQVVAQGPVMPSDGSQLQQEKIAVNEVSTWLGSKARIEPVCDALRLVLPTDITGLQRALNKLAVIRRLISTLREKKVQGEKAKTKCIEGSSKAPKPQKSSPAVSSKSQGEATASVKSAKKKNKKKNKKRSGENSNKQ